MGVPCIVSDAGALPETVDADCGWVVPRGDVRALTSALEDAYAAFRAGDLAGRGERARDRMVRHFDSRRAAGGVVDVIERAARGPRRP
jgi:glycosyltransferase involved in cell wall biosynthesis